MDVRLFLGVVTAIYGALALTFALDGNAVQAAVATLAALVSLSVLWWYVERGESAEV